MPRGVFGAGKETTAGATYVVIYGADGKPSLPAIRVGDGWHLHKTLYDYLDCYNLSDEDKKRIYAALHRQRIERVYEGEPDFKPATKVDQVHLGITAFDILDGASARLEVMVASTSLKTDAAGLVLHMKTWADTKVWSAKIHWLTP